MSTCRIFGLGLCAVALGMAMVTPAWAADPPSVGILAGVNIASASLSGADATNINTSSKAGLNVGVFAVWPLGSVLAIQPEITYSQRHFGLKDTVGSFSPEEKWSWIEVPVLARVTVWHSGKQSLFVNAGPGFNFRASAKEDANGTSSDVKSFIQSSQVTLMGGAGFAVGHAAVALRYDRGLRDLNKNNGLGDLVTLKDHAVTVNAMWSFDLK